jgi:hypothetical protein
MFGFLFEFEFNEKIKGAGKQHKKKKRRKKRRKITNVPFGGYEGAVITYYEKLSLKSIYPLSKLPWIDTVFESHQFQRRCCCGDGRPLLVFSAAATSHLVAPHPTLFV